MELLGVLFIISFLLNVFLYIDNKRLLHDVEWLANDKEKLMKKYLDLHRELYKTTFNQDKNYLTIDFENNSQIKCIETDTKNIRSKEVWIWKC